MNALTKIWLVVTLSWGLTLSAAEIIKFIPGETNFLAMSKDPAGQITINNSLCFYQQKKQLACGLVIRLSDKGYIVALDTIHNKAALKAGEKVEIRRASRSTAAQSAKLEIVQTAYEVDYSFKGVMAGTSLLSPYARFEQMLLPWLNLGVMPMYLNSMSVGQGTLSGPGVFATASAFPLEPFDKLWGMSGIGGFFASAKAGNTTEKILCLAAFVSGGWRMRFSENLTAGAGVGAQFFLLPGNAALVTTVSGLAPLFLIDIGIIF